MPEGQLDWDALIVTALAQPRTQIQAIAFLGCPYNSRSRPAVFLASDTKHYVAKSRTSLPYRYQVNDCIAASLGQHLQAPTPIPTILTVDASLTTSVPLLSDFRAGECYATPQDNDLSNRLTFEHAAATYNRSRLARLALLYAWIGVMADQQLMYRTSGNALVFSLDHEQSVTADGNWQVADLASPAALPPDAWIVTGASLTVNEIHAERPLLEAVTPEKVAESVALPPPTWPITNAERVEFAKYLWTRRQLLLQSTQTVTP